MDVSRETRLDTRSLNTRDIKNSWIKPEVFKLDNGSILGAPGSGSDIGSIVDQVPLS